MPKKTHGLSNTRIFAIWKGMKRRCYSLNDVNYHNYGRGGICICDEWLNKESGFTNFYKWAMANDYADNLSLDREDNNGNYTPENCRWTTRTIQNRNKRRRSTNLSGFNGVSYKTDDKKWAAQIGINGRNYLVGKYNTIEEAITARKQAEADY